MADLEEKPANKKIDDAEIEDDEEESSDEPLGTCIAFLYV